MSVRNVRTGYYYKAAAPAAEDPEENDKTIFEKDIFGIPIGVVALVLGGLLVERKISGAATASVFAASMILSQ